MEIIFSHLRSVLRLAVEQPLMTLAAVLVIALALGADGTMFKDLDASLSHAVESSGPVSGPLRAAEIRPEFRTLAAANSIGIPERPASQNVASVVDQPTAGNYRNGKNASRTKRVARSPIMRPNVSHLKINVPNAIAIDLRLAPAIRFQETRDLGSRQRTEGVRSKPRTLAVAMGADLTKLIAGRARIDQAEFEMEIPDAATIRRWKIKSRSETETLSRRFTSVRFQPARPLPATGGAWGGR